MQMDSITRERGVKLKSGRGQKLMESFRVKSKTKNLRSFFCYPITNKKPRLSLGEERTNEPSSFFPFQSTNSVFGQAVLSGQKKTKKDESSYPPDVV
jgi:hypothetical protein